MRQLELWILGYVLNSLWQAPVIFAVAWLAARMVRAVGPRAEHRVWVAALLAETILPACNFRWSDALQAIQGLARRLCETGAVSSQVQVLNGPGVAGASTILRLPKSALPLGAILYGCVLAYFTGRLLGGLWMTRTLTRTAEPLNTQSGRTVRLSPRARAFGIDATGVAISKSVLGPMTVGIWRKVILLPPGFLENATDNELNAVLSHEAAHMQRRDFAKNLAYRLVSLPVAFHPVLWQTLARLAESREMVCDAIAAGSAVGRESYARTLLRLASALSERRPATTFHAIGIFDANTFERRLMRLTGKQNEIRGVRRLAVVLATAALAASTCASAVAFSLRVDAVPASSTTEGSGAAAPKRVMVSSGVMAANNLTKANPKYPEDAKKAKIQGKVVLKAVTGKDGLIRDLQVVSGPKELQQSSLDAVKQWTYKPYLLNGDPVEVETEINVIYTLAP